MAEHKRYWSVTECGWVPSPGAPDMLATPWGLAAEKAPEPAPMPELPGQRRPAPQQVDSTR